MTRYEEGFMNKCAEYGLDVGTSVGLMKAAFSDSDKVGLGGLAGMGIGAAIGVNGVNNTYGRMAQMMRGAGITRVPKLSLMNKLMIPSVAKSSLRGGAIGVGGVMGAMLLSRLFNRNRGQQQQRF